MARRDAGLIKATQKTTIARAELPPFGLFQSGASGAGIWRLAPGYYGAAGMAVIALAGVFASPAGAQQALIVDQYLSTDIPGIAVEPGVTVLSRSRPQYDAVGIRLGEVTIRPQLLETVGFDDNPAGRSEHRGSAIIETNAQVQALYDHSDTTGFATLSVDDNEFLQQSAQSYTNWSAAVGGTHTFDRDVLTANYAHLNLNQTPAELDVPQLNSSLPYAVDTGTVSYRATFAHAFVQPQLDVSAYSYTNGSAGGVTYQQTYRNRTVVQPSVTLGYELAPRRDLVLVVRDAVSDYTQQVNGTPTRNYNDVSVLGGVDFADGGPFRYRLLVGYETRQFSSSQYKTISAPIVEAEVLWSPTGLTTVTGIVARHIQDSANDTTVGLTETSASLRVDHELLRNVLVQANGAYYVDDYSQGQGSQQLFTVGTGATWLLNRNLRLQTTYSFSRRTSSGHGELGCRQWVRRCEQLLRQSHSPAAPLRALADADRNGRVRHGRPDKIGPPVLYAEAGIKNERQRIGGESFLRPDAGCVR